MVMRRPERLWRRKDFLIGGGGGGGARFETTHRVVSNLYNNYENLGGTCPRCLPGSYAYERVLP